MKKLLALAGLTVLGGSLAFVLAGCGSDKAVSLGPPPGQTSSTPGSDGTGTGPSTATGPATRPEAISFEAWFARGERLVPQLRTHAATPRVANAAVQALLTGPTRAERASGLHTAVPTGTRLLGVTIRNGVGTVDLTSNYQTGAGSLSMQVRLGQVVYTLTQFPTVKAVRFQLDGAPVNVFSSAGIVVDHPVSRSDYRDLVPEISVAEPIAGTWRRLPAAPIAVDGSRASVWTGRQMIVFGRRQLTASDARGNPFVVKSVNVAAAYDPTTDTWRRLAPPPGPTGSFEGSYSAVWTGREMLVWGPFDVEAFNPATNRWRGLPTSPLAPTGRAGGIVVWTGREMIGWGGGCCGDAFSDGAAYNPATNTWRKLARSPLAGGPHPTGAWTGRELIIFVRGLDPNGNPWPARLARAAAYDPTSDSWRRISPLPEPRDGARAVWDGHEVLVVGGAGKPEEGRPPALATVGFAYDPASRRWRRLAPLDSGRIGAAAVWTGKRLLVWGGQTGGPSRYVIPPHGLGYDPGANRWAALSQAPLLGRPDPTAVWTGRAMIVWGGERNFVDGASFTPAGP